MTTEKLTPQFITPCYVRVEDADKRKELTKSAILIGRTVIGSENKYLIAEANTSTCVAIWSGLEGQPTNALRACKFIDCGTNTELFLALASMRSDTDKGQWFVCEESYADPMLDYQLIEVGMLVKQGEFDQYAKAFYRKATATEIIEHFKTKTK